MRVLLDPNVLISYLLHPDPARIPRRVVEAAFLGEYELLVSGSLLEEVRSRVMSKPYLASNITAADLKELLELLQVVASLAPNPDEPIPAVGSDRGDDYFFAIAALEGVDVLVSGDAGVQRAGTLAGVTVMSPAAFADLLDRRR